jgi:GT2 family glycosyltransferase
MSLVTAADILDEVIPRDLDLTLLGRRPAKLSDATACAIAAMPVPVAAPMRREAPPVSIVIVTYNNLPFTKLCLASLIQNTIAPDYEVIVVDNASTDGTPDYLGELAQANPLVRVIINDTNRGFAAANNQGLAAARGEVLVLLNNDTIVPPLWLAALVSRLDDPRVGLAGPVTNRIGNEAEIETTYRTYGEMLRFAAAQAQAAHGQAFDIPVPCMFCLAVRRDAYERIGPLDERFEVGLLEDDDYARRAHDADYRTVCAEDAFVHHFGQASFGALVPTGEYGRILAANRLRFEAKWGEPWKPYGRRVSESYAECADGVRRAVSDQVPRGAVVAVVSRGDDGLLRFDGATGWHFPQADDGTYAGHYPADSDDAVAQLERLRSRGAQYLVMPATAAWWLDHYAGFAEFLGRKCGVLFDDPKACRIYQLPQGDRR